MLFRDSAGRDRYSTNANVVQVLSPIAVHISLEEAFWFVRFSLFFVCFVCHQPGNSEIEVVVGRDRIRKITT